LAGSDGTTLAHVKRLTCRDRAPQQLRLREPPAAIAWLR
jgi:hypothetical protein